MQVRSLAVNILFNVAKIGNKIGMGQLIVNKNRLNY
jgi:hypothetical protein